MGLLCTRDQLALIVLVCVCVCVSDGKATLGVKQGGFRTEDSAEHVIEIEVGDGTLKSIEPLHIRVCQCNGNRTAEYCKPHRRQVGVSVHALITILLCIVTILGKLPYSLQGHSLEQCPHGGMPLSSLLYVTP